MRGIIFFTFIFFTILEARSQCPVYDKRNNGQGTSNCASGDVAPSGKIKSGEFSFTTGSTSTNFTIDSILLNGQKYQQGSVLYNSLGSVWFGGYNGSKKTICFYGNNVNDNTPPAGRWKFYFNNGGTQTICSYTVDASGNPSNLDPGIIGSNQTICSGNTPTTLSNTTSASGCPTGSPTYQWQYSTTSSSNGYTNVPSGGTSSTYSPGALTQKTYYIRISTCSDGTSASTEPVTITVVTAGTISASPSTWAGLNSTTQFSSTGTSGGTWTSSNTSVAIIDPSTGVLTTKGSGTTTITYTVLSGCTATKTVTIDANLPVVWGLITPSKVNGNVEIDWSTASEQNTKDFEIQYSTNTTDWSAIGTVLAAGNSSSPKNYSFIHTSPLKNNNYNYYRILQRDLDGKFSYSKIVSILFNEPGPDVVVYPNPVEEVLTIYTSTEQVVSLYNAAGSLVWKAKLPAGRNQLPVNNFSKGVYILATNELKTRVIIR